MTIKEIERIIEESDDIDEFISAKEELIKRNMPTNEIDELINDVFDCFEIDELKKYREILCSKKLSISYIDRLLNRKEGITVDKILNMDEEDIRYFAGDPDLNLYCLLILRKRMNDYKFELDEINYIDSLINEEIDELEDKNEIKKIKALMHSYNLDTSYINSKLLGKLNSTLTGIATYNLVSSIFKSNVEKTQEKEYEEYNMEEEELEEDDYHYEDLD